VNLATNLPKPLAKEIFMRKLMQLTVVSFAVATMALAAPIFAPELDGGTIPTGLGLLFGAALMIRRKR